MTTSPKKSTQFSTTTILVGIVIVSVILRFAAVFYLGDRVESLPGVSDQISYHTLAQRLLGGYGFTFGEGWWPMTQAGAPTSHWSFIYTFYLAGLYSITGVKPLLARLVQAILVGMLHPLLAFWIGRRVFNQPAGLVAAAFTAVYTYFIYYTATLMTEPFYILAIMAGLLFCLMYIEGETSAARNPRRDWLLAGLLGLALGVAVLLRQLFLLLIPFLLVWAWWARRKKTGKSPFWPLLLSLGIVIIMILPFTICNYTRFNRFVLLNTNAGYAFYFGNHPIYGTRFIPILDESTGGYSALIPKELHQMDEASLDQELLKRGIQFVVDDPGRYLLLSLSRAPVYFQFWPSQDSGLLSNLARVSSFGLLWPLMLYGFIFSFIRRPWTVSGLVAAPAFLLQMFVFIYTMIHLLTWALIRYRLPVDAVLIIFAGAAVIDLANRLSRLRKRRVSSLSLFPGLIGF
jgi:4-amino-4-deoxy-L-arabinose transferase-like glycosyltransferase